MDSDDRTNVVGVQYDAIDCQDQRWNTLLSANFPCRCKDTGAFDQWMMEDRRGRFIDEEETPVWKETAEGNEVLVVERHDALVKQKETELRCKFNVQEDAEVVNPFCLRYVASVVSQSPS